LKERRKELGRSDRGTTGAAELRERETGREREESEREGGEKERGANLFRPPPQMVSSSSDFLTTRPRIRRVWN
jgi:hypothetical protein